MLINVENKRIEIDSGITCYDLLKRVHNENYKKYLAVIVNNSIKELTFSNLKEGDKIRFLDITNPDGLRIYIRTLSLIFIKACRIIFGDAKVIIEHSLNKGLYVEVKLDRKLNYSDINKIKLKMKYLINLELPINKKMLSIDDAKKVFEMEKLNDKVNLLNHWNTKYLRVYELDGYYDTFYGYVAPNTNVINLFDIKLFGDGLVLRFPRMDYVNELPDYVENYKLAKIFKESEDWGEIMEVSHVGSLNSLIANNEVDNLIRVNEALHEKKIAYIADEISADNKIKIVLIAGPSSSGKTTFAQRLSIQLRVNGKKTYAISLDDYFVDREKTPKDEFGNYDFETIDALDLQLFNEHLLALINGKEVQIPTFDFMTGKRVYNKLKTKLTDDYIIVVEGIHGLNEKLTLKINKKNKFKIYISALTQLNIDNHNRISTSDTRLIRRIVRDNTFRGHNARRTMELWNNVRKGEEKYIFPYQENADVMFNSSLVYELSVLKKYAVKLISEIDNDCEYNPEKQRLLKFLSYFKSLDEETVIPQTSIIKEFLGGGLLE